MWDYLIYLKNLWPQRLHTGFSVRISSILSSKLTSEVTGDSGELTCSERSGATLDACGWTVCGKDVWVIGAAGYC